SVKFTPEDGGLPSSVSGVLQPGASGAFFNVPTLPRAQTTVYTGQLYVSETETGIHGTLTVQAPVQPPLLDRIVLEPSGVRGTENAVAIVWFSRPAPPGGLELTFAATSSDVIMPLTQRVDAGSHGA